MLQRADAKQRRECCTSCGEWVDQGGFYYFHDARVCGPCMRELIEGEGRCLAMQEEREREELARQWADRHHHSSGVGTALAVCFVLWAFIAAAAIFGVLFG